MTLLLYAIAAYMVVQIAHALAVFWGGIASALWGAVRKEQRQ